MRAALLVGQQVPLVGAHERVDADVVARGSSSARNAGTWLLLNSAGRCSAICDQTGSSSAAERGAPERAVGVLQVRRRSSACHQIMKSASARRPATSYVPRTTTSLAASCVEQRLDLVRHGGPVGVAERTRAAGTPTTSCSGWTSLSSASRAAFVVLARHCAAAFSRHGAPSSVRPRPSAASAPGRPRRPAAEAMQAGMPTPSYAAPHTARPGTRATSARIRATRSR